MIRLKTLQFALACSIAGMCLAAPAQAYVGPGAGVTLIGALIGLVSAVFLALWAVLRWPIRRYLARRKAAKSQSTGTGTP
jgi:hypothetical protein